MNTKGECRTKIDSTRLLTLNAARMIDTVGTKNARIEISIFYLILSKNIIIFISFIGMIKIVAPRVACEVIDSAI